MSEDNKAIAIRFIKALGLSQLDIIKASISVDIEAIATGTSVLSGSRGYDEVVAAAAVFEQVTKAGIRFEVINATAEDDRVALEIEGHSELANGLEYNNQYHILFFLREGKIVKMKEYMDTKLADAVLGPLFAS